MLRGGGTGGFEQSCNLMMGAAKAGARMHERFGIAAGIGVEAVVQAAHPHHRIGSRSPA